MLNEVYGGIITAVSASTKKSKNEDGTTSYIPTCKFKVQTDEIDYETLAKSYPSVSATLLNIQPMPFVNVDFGDISMFNMNISMFKVDEDKVGQDTDEPDAFYKNIRIKDLKVKNVANMPVYLFTVEMVIENSITFLFNNVKHPINFKFNKEAV
jgi:hypothetical protein